MQQLPENMSGLMPPREAETAVMPGPQDMGGDQASPEEQALYERFVGNALKVLFNEQALPNIMETLNTPDPMQGVANVTAMLVQRVAAEAQKVGDTIPTDVLFAGGAEIFENVVEVAENAGVFDFSKNPKVVQGAMIRAFDEMRVALQGMGMIDQAEMQADLQELQQADANGGLAEMFGGMAQPAQQPRGLMGGMA